MTSGRRFYDARALAMLRITLDEAQDLDSLFSHASTRTIASVCRRPRRRAYSPERRGLYREAYRVRDTHSGEERWISGVGRTLFENGVCIRFMGVLEDVTEARHADAHKLLLIHELNPPGEEHPGAGAEPGGRLPAHRVQSRRRPGRHRRPHPGSEPRPRDIPDGAELVGGLHPGSGGDGGGGR